VFFDRLFTQKTVFVQLPLRNGAHSKNPLNRGSKTNTLVIVRTQAAVVALLLIPAVPTFHVILPPA